MLQWDPPGICYPEANPKYLVSNKESPKKGHKGSNIAKDGQKKVTLPRPMPNFAPFLPKIAPFLPKIAPFLSKIGLRLG